MQTRSDGNTKAAYVVLAFVAAVIAARVGTARADFTLEGTEHLDVTTSHTNGFLYDASTADILTGGYVGEVYVSDEARLRVQRPSDYAVGFAYVYNAARIAVSSGSVGLVRAYNTSTVDISGGSFSGLLAWDSSTIDISGGSVGDTLCAADSSRVAVSGGSVAYLYTSNTSTSTVTVSGGSISDLYACGTSTVAISGGSVSRRLDVDGGSRVDISGGNVSGDLYALGWSSVTVSGGSVFRLDAMTESNVDISSGHVEYLSATGRSSVTVSGGSLAHLWASYTSTVTVSGGSVGNLYACDTGDVALDGYDFRAMGGLTLVEYEIINGVPQYEVLGTGLLIGKWFDGTSWGITIDINDATATIRAIPEPVTLGLLALGGLALVKRRKRLCPGRIPRSPFAR